MLGVVGVAGSNKRVDFAIVFPAQNSGRSHSTQNRSIREGEELVLRVDGTVFDGIEDLEIFEGVTALIAQRAVGSEATSLFPTSESFVREVEFGGDFLDCVELVHTCTSRRLSKFVGRVFELN